MKRAFTLLEVIISAMIISFMSIGILQMQSNTTHNLAILDQQREINHFASSMLNRPDAKLHNKKQDLYTFLKDRYTIDYAPLITLLKKEKVTFTQTDIASIKLNLAKAKAEEDGALNSNLPDPVLLMKRNQLQKASQSAQTITFELLQ